MHLTIRDLGPHAETTIPLTGRVTIRGASESGKSTIVRALAFVAFGTDETGAALPVDAIREGERAAEVTLTWDGHEATRRIVDGKSRSVARRVDGLTASTEAAFRDRLPLGGDALADVARVVMVPHGWQSLALGEGGGRPLRDLLAKHLPGDLTAADVLDKCLEPGEPRTEKAALAARLAARRDRDTAAGVLSACTDRLREVEARTVAAPDAEAVEAARQALADAEAARTAWQTWDAARAAYARAERAMAEWEARAARVVEPTEPEPSDDAIRAAADADNAARRDYDAALAAWTEADRAHRRAEGDLRAWRARRDSIRPPDRAEPSAADLANLRAEIAGLRKVVDRRGAAAEAAAANVPPLPPVSDAPRIVTEIATLDDRLAAAKRRAGMLDDVPCGGAMLYLEDDATPIDCGACPLLADATAARRSIEGIERDLADARARLTAAEAAHAAASAAYEANTEALRKARAEWTEATERLFEREADLADAESDRAAWDAYRKAVADLGPEPTLPPHPGERPLEPATGHLYRSLTRTRAAWDAYRAAVAALGERPTLPPAPGPEPVVPDTTTATATLRAAEDAERDRARLAADVQAARERVADAEGAYAAAVAAAERADEVVRIVRDAPGVALRAKLGPVQTEYLRLTVPEPDEDGKAPAIVVEIRDGAGRWLPWHLASTGRRIVADAAFRAALRAAVPGLERVPVVVDEVQSVGGIGLPDVPAPVVLLTTTATGGLTVDAGEPAVEVA